MCHWVLLAAMMWSSVFLLRAVGPHAFVLLCHIGETKT